MSNLLQKLKSVYRTRELIPKSQLEQELKELEVLTRDPGIDPEARILWLLIVAREQIEMRDLNKAGILLSEAESIIDSTQRLHLLPESQQLRSIILRHQGRNEEAFQLLIKAYTAGQTLEDHWTLANASLDLGVIAANSGDYDGASVYLKRCLEHADLGEIESDLPAHAHLVLAQAQLERGAMDEAHYHATQSLFHYVRLNNHSRAASAASLLASVNIEKKDLAAAREVLEGVRQESLSRSQLISLYNLEAKLNSLEGRFEDAVRNHDEAIRIASEISTERLKTNSIQLKCETLLLQGKAAETLELLSQLSGEQTKGYDLLSLHELRAKALEQLDRYKEALEEQKKFAVLQKDLLSERASNALSRLRAAQEVLQAEREAAHFRERSQFYAKELSQRTSYLVQQNEHVNNVIGHIQSLADKHPKAAEELKDIRKQLRQLPAASFDWTEYLRLFDEIHPNALEILQQKYPKLSKTESRICSLVLAKLSNMDIGRLLAVSERTVENHRYRLRKKLELSVDVDLGAFLEQIISESQNKKEPLKPGLQPAK
jgi:DNA-binding CsgD family transcriptional regulator